MKTLPVIHIRNSIVVGGVETTLVGWMKYFEQSGVAARLFCFRNAGNSHLAYQDYLTERAIPCELLPWSTLKLFPMAVARLVAAIRSLPGCVIHTHDVRSDIVGLMAARLTRTPIMSTCHAWHDVAGKVRFLEYIDARVLQHVDLVGNVSEATRRGSIMRGIPEHKAITLYSGIDLAPFQVSIDRTQARSAFGIDPHAFVIGNVARLYPEKGQNLLIKAAAQLAGHCPDMHFIIVGEGPLQHKLIQLADQLGVSDQVHILEFQHDLARLLAALDLFALPSYAEGTPMVIYSAMAMGLPIVASRIDGVAEVLQDGRTARFIDAGDVDALSKEILSLYRSHDARAAMGREAKAVVHKHYSAHKATSALATIYRDLLHHHHTDSGKHDSA